jgi:hypothetical protein
VTLESRRSQILGGLLCLALLVAICGMGLVAVTEGGYHPERYVGRFDPFRAGMLVLIVPGLLLMAIFAAGSTIAWRARPTLASFALVVTAVGWLIACFSLVVLVIEYPNRPGGWRLPAPIAATLLVGVGTAFLGSLPSVSARLRDAIARRDRYLIVGLTLIAALLIAVALRRY